MAVTMFYSFFRILYVSEEKYGNEPVCQKWNVKFGRTGPTEIFRSEGTETDLSIWLSTEISGVFGIMESTRALSSCVGAL